MQETVSLWDLTLSTNNQTINEGKQQIEQRAEPIKQKIEAEKGGSVNIRVIQKSAKEVINTPKDITNGIEDYLSQPATPNKDDQKPQIKNGGE